MKVHLASSYFFKVNSASEDRAEDQVLSFPNFSVCEKGMCTCEF